MLIGIVGKPSVGKSTFFKAATLAEVEIANYPFTTIKPNSAVGYVKVKDAAKEFEKTANPRTGFILEDWRFVPVQLLDVAGLVPGAHKGEGMGAQFLNDLNQADALVHVVDISGSVNEKGEQVEALSYDPANDIRFLEKELDYWYLEILKRGWDKFSRQIVQEKSQVHKALGKQLSGLGVNEDMVKKAIETLQLNAEKPNAWTDDQMYELARTLRITTKPMLIAANKIDVPGAADNLIRLEKEFPEYTFIGCSAESELALREAAKHKLIKYIPGESNFEITGDLSEQQTKALSFIKEKMLDTFKTTGVQDVLDKAVFTTLDYIAIHPGGVGKLEDQDGNTLPDCFLMKNGSTTLDFAFKLHTDFGKKFICAKDVRTKMTLGKEHVLKHLDIIEIVAGK